MRGGLVIGEARTAADYSNGTLRHMAPRDELPILEPADGRAWERWLERHHADPGRLAEAGQEGSGRTQLIAGKRMRRSRGLPAGTGPRPPPPGPSSRP